MRARFFVVAAGVVLSVFACTSSEDVAAPPTTPGETDASVEAGADAAPAETSTSDDAGDAVDPSSYCETTAGAFCAFYMRCGRMAAVDEAECKTVFAEACNARYEPRYVDLAAKKLVRLSRSGVDACIAHLAKVACDDQRQDLDGPCAAMWVGSSPKGAPCGIDVESFVCGAGTTCVLALDLCGTCRSAAARGASCAPPDLVCEDADACVMGTCVARAKAGEDCAATKPCLTGVTCTAGKCVPPAYVKVGDTCDQARRCPYRAYCDAGQCAKQSLLGEDCASTRACASGRCVGGKCVALLGPGETCGAGSDCASAVCSGGKCRPLPSACFDPK